MMKKNFGKMALITLILIAGILLTGIVCAENKLVPKVDNFIILVDQSGSMFMTHQGAVPAKAKLAKDILSAMNDRIPELSYVGAIQLSPPSKTVIGPEKYDHNLFGDAIQNLPETGRIFGNRTPLGKSILDLDELLQAMPAGRTSVIIVSDGEENLGIEAIEAARTIRARHTDLCFHVISLADSESGRSTLKRISQLGDCGVFDEGDGLFPDNAALDDFVKNVFYSTEVIARPLDSDRDGVVDNLDNCPNTPRGVRVDTRGCPVDSDGDGIYDYLDQCPGTPEGAKVDERGCWVVGGIQFEIAKSDIKSPSYPILDEIIEVLERNPSVRVEIEGHTDSTGPAALNRRLSEQRAKAVMEYFVSKGIDRSRLSAKGYGSSKPIASNDNPAGQAKNRRVELKPIF